jgi:hypothetical protein
VIGTHYAKMKQFNFTVLAKQEHLKTIKEIEVK